MKVHKRSGGAVRVGAIDLGASSGRVVEAEVGTDGLRYREVHRFSNRATQVGGGFFWDIDNIYRNVIYGLGAGSAGAAFDSVGVDSWAVDFGLLNRSGGLVASPRSHRDPHFHDGMDRLVQSIGADELYSLTGLQQLPFNTICQLLAPVNTTHLDVAESMLMIPDLLGYWMTGSQGAERTNASTTQLYDISAGSWALPLVEELGLPRRILPELRDPGEHIGTVRLGLSAGSDVASKSVPVIAVCSHDTASAVVSIPANGTHFAYISSGTWSLVGVELDSPILTTEARAAGFSNEAGIDGSIRFLTNVMGLWVLSECQRHWSMSSRTSSDIESLISQAAAVSPLRWVIDINDHRLMPPSGEGSDAMPARVCRLADERGEPVPVTPAEITRCVIDSLALSYRRAIRRVSSVTRLPIDVIHMVGGGSRHPVLCQLTADACEVPLIAGPTEATAIGNALVQARSLGVDLGDRDSMRALVGRTHHLPCYLPRCGTQWARAAERAS